MNLHKTRSRSRAAIYGLVTAHNGHADSESLRRHALRQGWRVTDYLESDLGSRRQRDRLVRDLEEGFFDLVLCSTLSDLAEGLGDLRAFVETLLDFDVALIAIDDNLDLNPVCRSATGLIPALGAFERRRRARIIREGLQRVRLAGKRIGRPVRVLPTARLHATRGLPNSEAATTLGISAATLKRWRRRASTSESAT